MLTWIAQNTLVALGLASLALAATVFLPKRPAIGHVLWVCVLVALVAPPLPRHGLLDGRSHAVHAATSAAATVRTIMPGTHTRQASPSARTSPSSPRYTDHSTPRSISPSPARQRNATSTMPPESRTTRREWTPAALPATPPAHTPSPLPTAKPAFAALQNPVADTPAALPATSEPKPTRTATPPHNTAVKYTKQSRWSVLLDAINWRAVLINTLIAAWILGIAIVSRRAVKELAVIARMVRRGSRPSPAFCAFVERVAMDMGVRAPRVRISDEVTTPFVWGALRPTLIWPASETETAPGARAVIAHELAHLERRDHWTAWLETATTCVLWWHPLVYVARRQLRRQAERACDAWVVWAYPTDRRHYADALLDAVERLGLSPRAATALGAVDTDRRSLTRRLLMIMNDNVARRGSRALALAAAGLTAVFAPTWAAASRPAMEAITSIGTDIDRPLEALLKQAKLEWEAELYAQGGDEERARKAANALLKLKPDDADLHSRVAMMFYEAEDYIVAAKHFTKAGDLEPDDADHTYNAACCYALAGNNDEALKTLALAVARGYADGGHAEDDSDLRSLRKSPEFKELTARIGDLEDVWDAADEALDEEHWHDAAKGFASAASLAPECAELQHLLGFASIRAGDIDAARDAFTAAMELGFHKSYCLYNLACVATADGQYDKAFDLLDGAVEAGFTDHELLREDADLEPLHNDSRFKALVRDVTAPAKLRRELEMAMEFGEYEAAVEKARAYLDDYAREFEHSWVNQRLGMALFMSEDYRGAERAFSDAAEGGYPLEDSLYNIACCKAKRGDTDGAMEYLHAAVEAGYTDGEHMQADSDLDSLHDKPGFAKITQMAADRSILKGFAAPSWEYLEARSTERIKADPEDGSAHLQLGWALLRTDRTKDAMNVFEEQADLGFMPGIAHYNIACCHAILGDNTQAIAQLKQAIANGFDEVEFMQEDPDLANLHDDPRFTALMEAHESQESADATSDSWGDWSDAKDKVKDALAKVRDKK